LEGPFVGRQAEIAVLRAKLDEARSGHPSIVLIEGPPGIGKTALVDRFVRESSDVKVLRASGEESESFLTYGAVDQLLRFGGLDESTAPTAGKRQAAATEDHVTTGARLLDLLGSLQDENPVVLVVDDAHWADLPSLRALLFGLRRLVADQVLALIVVRDEQAAALPEGLRRLVRDQGATLRLAGLDAEDLRELAQAMGIETFSSRAAQRLHAHTQGNPLHARALLEELPTDTWRSDELPLRSPRSFSMLVLHRCTACSLEAQRLVEAASVLGLRCSLATAARLASVDEPLQALEEASRAGLLQPRDAMLGEHGVAFPHPLVQAAVYHDLGPARRAALHAAAAALAEDEATSLRHRVAAAPTVDPPLAQQLETFAGREAARGAMASAAASLVAASRLSPTPAERQRRLLQAVSSMLLGGDRRQAAGFAEDIASFPGGPLRDRVLGELARLNDRPREAERWLRSAWEQCDPVTDPPLAATIALTNAIHYIARLDGQEAVEWGRRAVALAAPGDAMRAVGEAVLATALAYAGRLPEGLATVESAVARTAATPGEGGLVVKTIRGWLRLVEEDLTGARADLADDAPALLRAGLPEVVVFAYSWLAWVEYCIGAWDDAVVHAERAFAIAVELEHPFSWWLVPFAAVPVPAARGDWAVAERHARQAASHGSGYEPTIVTAGIARALLATARRPRRRPGRAGPAADDRPAPVHRRARVLAVAGPVRRRPRAPGPAGGGVGVSGPARDPRRSARSARADRPAGPCARQAGGRPRRRRGGRGCLPARTAPHGAVGDAVRAGAARAGVRSVPTPGRPATRRRNPAAVSAGLLRLARRPALYRPLRPGADCLRPRSRQAAGPGPGPAHPPGAVRRQAGRLGTEQP
jgi:hypothetical protein